MLMNTTSVMLTVFVLNLHHRHDNKPVPQWVRRFIFNGLARILCMENKKHQVPKGYRPASCLYEKTKRKKSRDVLDGFSISHAAKQFSGHMRNSTPHSNFNIPTSYANSQNCNSIRRDNNSNKYSDNHHNQHFMNSTGGGESGDPNDDQNNTGGNAGQHAENLLRDLENQQYHLDEWRELARVMDRLFFWFTLFAMFGFCATVFFKALLSRINV